MPDTTSLFFLLNISTMAEYLSIKKIILFFFVGKKIEYFFLTCVVFIYRYWYLGPLKRKFAYFATTLRDNWPPAIQADITYTLPCSGCSKCVPKFEPPKWRWWHIFIKPNYEVPKIDYSQIVNDSCGLEHEEKISGLEFHAKIHESSIKVNVLDDNPEKLQYIKEGWAREKKKELNLVERKTIDVQSLKLKPILAPSKVSIIPCKYLLPSSLASLSLFILFFYY